MSEKISTKVSLVRKTFEQLKSEIENPVPDLGYRLRLRRHLKELISELHDHEIPSKEMEEIKGLL